MDHRTTTKSGTLSVLAFAALRVAAIFAAVLGASTASAQNGIITGTVVDAEGNPFGFADVFLEGEKSAFSETQLADDAGKFRFSPVPVGYYRLYAFATGYNSTKYTEIYLTPSQTQTFTLTLTSTESARLEEKTQVIANRIVVETARTDVAMTLGEDFIKGIPLQNKRIQDIVFLFPGVTRTGASDSTDISVGGGTAAQIGYRIDGQSANDPVGGGLLLDISTAAIQDFKLTTGGFRAEFGEQSSAIAEIITKSGTNELSFNYTVDFRSTDWGAQSIPELDDSNAFVDSILRGEGTLLEDDMATGFDLLGINPVSTVDDDNNPIPRHRVRQTVFASGPIIRDKLFFAATLESLRDDFGSAFVQGLGQNDQILNSTKFTWTLSDKNSLEVTTNLDVSDSSGFAAVRSRRSTNQDTANGTWLLSATDTHTFNDTTFMETKFSLQRQYAESRPENTRTGVGTQYRVPIAPGGITTFFVGDAATNQDSTFTSPAFDISLSKGLGGGEHEMKMGVGYQFVTFEQYVEQGTLVDDFRVADNRRSVFGVSPFVGRQTTFGDPVRTEDDSWEANFFVQDTWKVTKNFTLDVGLRTDYQSFVGDLFFAPRVGFALDPIGDGKTRFSGYWGLQYDNLFASALQWTANPDEYVSDIIFATAFVEREFAQTPITTIYKEAQSTQFMTRDADAVAYLAPVVHDRYVLSDTLTAPTTRQWGFQLERSLPADMRIQIGYTENKRSHQSQALVVTRREAQTDDDFEVRDRIQASTGEGRYRQWTAEIQKPFDRWQMNLSYTSSKNTGPIAPPANPLDPRDVVSGNGLLGNDRTHVVKLQGRGLLSPNKLKLDFSGDFTWQTGTPTDASITTSFGQTFYPLGRNSLRLPSTRQLNAGIKRTFATQDGKLSVTADLHAFNLLNEFNVVSAIGRFEVPAGLDDPSRFPPLRPAILPADVDVSRSVELGLVIGF